MDFGSSTGATLGLVLIACCALVFADPQPQRVSSGEGIKDISQSSAAGNVQRSIERAKHLLEKGSRNEAIDVLRKIIREKPQNADAHLLLGTALALIPEPSQALQALRQAVALRPAFAPGHFTLGTALARFTDLDGAKQMFEKAIELDPQFADAHSSLALVLAQRKEFAAARQHLVRAIKIQKGSPTAANTHYLLAKVLIEENRYPEALQELDAAIKLNPTNAEAYLSRGLLKKKLLDDQGALRSFERAVQFTPDNPVAQHQLGVGYLRADKASEAVLHLRKASELKPEDRSHLYQLCRALQRAGRSEEATECEQRLSIMVRTQLAADSDLMAGRLNNEGVELEKLGKVEAALEKYRSAVELDPLNTLFRRNFALALCRLEQWDEAIAELKDVIRADPEDIKAAQGLYIALESAKAAKRANAAGKKSR